MLEVIKVTHERGKLAVIYGHEGREANSSLILVGNVFSPEMTTVELPVECEVKHLDTSKWATLRDYCVMHGISHHGISRNSFTDRGSLLAAVKKLFEMRDSIEQSNFGGNMVAETAMA